MKGYTLTRQQGNVIKEVCRERGIKLVELARDLHLRPPHLSNTLAGEKNLQPGRAFQLHSRIGLDRRADFLKEYYSGYLKHQFSGYFQEDSPARSSQSLEELVGSLDSSLYDAFSVYYQELGKLFIRGPMDVKADILSTLGDLYRKYESVGKRK